MGDSPYEQLRPGEKSKPVPNLLDPTYQYIARKQFELVPDLVFSHSEHMRVRSLDNSRIFCNTFTVYRIIITFSAAHRVSMLLPVTILN